VLIYGEGEVVFVMSSGVLADIIEFVCYGRFYR